MQGGPRGGDTVVHLQGAALDAFNYEAPHLVRCRWGELESGLVTPTYFSSTTITCATTPAATLGAYRLYVSLNGIAPFEDTGLDFLYYDEPSSADIFSVSPQGGPNNGGTFVTIFANGLDALGTYKPPASGEGRCRWGDWKLTDDPSTFRETIATLVGDDRLVCSTLCLHTLARTVRTTGHRRVGF